MRVFQFLMKKAIKTKEQAGTLLFVSVALIMLGELIHFLLHVHELSNLFCLSGVWLMVVLHQSDFGEALFNKKSRTPLPFLESKFLLSTFAWVSVVLIVVDICDMLLAFFR